MWIKHSCRERFGSSCFAPCIGNPDSGFGDFLCLWNPESWALEYGIHLTNGIQNASSIDKKSLIQGRGAYQLHKPTGKKSCAKTRKKNYKIWRGGRTTRYNEYSNQLDSACFLRLHKRNGANHLNSAIQNFRIFHVNDTCPSLLAIRNPQSGF